MTIQPGLPRYGSAPGFPKGVWEAVEASRQGGHEKACTPEFGILLRSLARGRARILETGTAHGVGTAWLLDGIDKGSSLLTIEIDPALAESTRRRLGSSSQATVLTGDWSQALARAPFDLAFIDGGPAKFETALIARLMAPGGLTVFDDLTAETHWPAHLRERYPHGDPVRLAWAAFPGVRIEMVELTRAELAMLVHFP